MMLFERTSLFSFLSIHTFLSISATTHAFQAQQRTQHVSGTTTTTPASTSTLALRMTATAPGPQQSYDFDPRYYSPPVGEKTFPTQQASRITLTRFLSNAVKDNPELEDLESLLLAVQMGCKTISNLVNRAGLVGNVVSEPESGNAENKFDRDDFTDGRFYSMKRLDRLSTTILKNALQFTGKVRIWAPKATVDSEEPDEHQPGVLIASALDSNYVACLDPLDGSGNADASICTGTVFGVLELENDEAESSGSISAVPITRTTAANEMNDSPPDDDRVPMVPADDDPLLQAVLQPAKRMRAAGYCLYSSATVLVFTLKEGVYGFTLDPQIQEFVLTHDNLTIPPRGTVYSCNEANSEGWPDEWGEYLKKLKLGEGETKTRYAHRYVGSMVGDVHRTLLYGGIFAYPSNRLHKPQGNLQLLYKSAPMAFLVHHAGGKAMDESGANLLDKRPDRIHQKSPCFMGSPADMDELHQYLSKISSSS